MRCLGASMRTVGSAGLTLPAELRHERRVYQLFPMYNAKGELLGVLALLTATGTTILGTMMALMATMLLGGLWHGAGATFIIWGLYHGLFLVVERMGLGKLLEKNCFRGLNHIYTALVVVVGWVFFRADTLADAKVILHQMFTWENGIYPASLFVNRKVIFLAVLGVLLSGIAQSICPKLREHLYEKEVTKTVDIVIMAVLLFLCTMYLVSSTYNPFIYFRF
jgi:alginate O-acetyltransferase complex protein AlgI